MPCGGEGAAGWVWPGPGAPVNASACVNRARAGSQPRHSHAGRGTHVCMAGETRGHLRVPVIEQHLRVPRMADPQHHRLLLLLCGSCCRGRLRLCAAALRLLQKGGSAPAQGIWRGGDGLPPGLAIHLHMGVALLVLDLHSKRRWSDEVSPAHASPHCSAAAEAHQVSGGQVPQQVAHATPMPDARALHTQAAQPLLERRSERTTESPSLPPPPQPPTLCLRVPTLRPRHATPQQSRAGRGGGPHLAPARHQLHLHLCALRQPHRVQPAADLRHGQGGVPARPKAHHLGSAGGAGVGVRGSAGSGREAGS